MTADIRTTDITPTPCPVCQTLIEAATGPGAPTPGSITLCLYCRAILVFGDDLHQRLLTNAEWAGLNLEERALITRLREGLVKVHTR